MTLRFQALPFVLGTETAISMEMSRRRRQTQIDIPDERTTVEITPSRMVKLRRSGKSTMLIIFLGEMETFKAL